MAVWTSIKLSEIRSGFRVDSEFYREEYIQKDHELFKLKPVSLDRLAKVTDGEHGSVKFVKDGIKYLTAENVRQGYIDIQGIRYISPEDDQRNARARVCAGDVLISIKGTLGEVAVAEEQLLPANMNRDVAIIKPFTTLICGRYISAFLRSKYGEYQLAREGSGGVQQMITLERLRNIQVPILSNDDVKIVSREYQHALTLRQDSLKLYAQAQQLLESELGLFNLQIPKVLGYTTYYSKPLYHGRFDADYFQPKYDLLKKIIENYKNGFEPLLEICKLQKPNIDPSKSPQRAFSYIELSNINSALGTVDGYTTSLGNNLPSRARREVSKGDVIASSVVGSIDKAAIITDMQDGYIASTGFFHFRPKLVAPEYLLMLVRSQCVQMQFEQQATGGILSAIPDSRLKYVIIPKIPDGIQEQIVKMITDSHAKKNESNKLIEQAKHRIEQLIEEAIQNETFTKR